MIAAPPVAAPLRAPWPGEPRAAVLGDEAPWRTGDLLRSAGLAGIGLAGLAGAWVAASGRADWADELPWATFGAVATSVAVLGLVSWLVAGLRRVAQLRREVLPLVKANAAGRTSARPVSPAGVLPSGSFVIAPGMTRFHVTGCPLTSGKPVRPLATGDAEAGGLVPCGVCAA